MPMSRNALAPGLHSTQCRDHRERPASVASIEATDEETYVRVRYDYLPRPSKSSFGTLW